MVPALEFSQHSLARSERGEEDSREEIWHAHVAALEQIMDGIPIKVK